MHGVSHIHIHGEFDTPKLVGISRGGFAALLYE